MLICEICGHETKGLVCAACQGENLPAARFCCYCGQRLSDETAGEDSRGRSSGDPYDLENRVLCSDESCIGIINEEGVCTECGRPYKGKAEQS